VAAHRSILIRVSGPDRPGITAALMELLTTGQSRIEDVEQIVIRGRLNLSLIVAFQLDDEQLRDLRADLLLFGYDQKLTVDFETVESTPSRPAPGLVVTILGALVTPAELGAVASVVAANQGNIERIIRLAKYPVMAYELTITGPDRDAMQAALLAHANELSCDVAVHYQGLGRRAHRLVVMDVDSTLIQDEAIEMLAEEAGSLEEVAAITARAMAGELDFTQSLVTRVATLAGLDAGALDRVNERIRLTPGARTFLRTLRRLGYRTAIVSGGFTSVTDHLAAELGIDHTLANTLEIVDGKLTGRTQGLVVDREAKAEFVRSTAAKDGIPLDQVVAVGDGANDLDMLQTVGLGIAFNAKPVVRQIADTAVNVPYLDAVLFVLGMTREEIEEADLVAGIDDDPLPVPPPPVHPTLPAEPAESAESAASA
jgi:phosphoserine phosphatase